VTLHTYPDVVQGTDEWHDQRRGMVTASVVGQLITPSTLRTAANPASRSLTKLLVAERVTGFTDPTYVGDDMIRGWDDEPAARAWYSTDRAPVTEVGFMVRDDWGWPLGCSPDGLVGDDGLIEIKSRRPKIHLATILANQVPAENVAQVQCALLVSGRAWCDYLSWCGGMPPWVIRVHPDPAWHAAIERAVAEFEQAAAELTAAYRQAVKGLPVAERTTEMEMIL
jgi:hypothetical protein